LWGWRQPATGLESWQDSQSLCRTYPTVKKRLIIIGATILVAMMVSFAFSGEMVAWLNVHFPTSWCLRTDGSVVCLESKFPFLLGDPGESARHLLSVLEVY